MLADPKFDKKAFISYGLRNNGNKQWGKRYCKSNQVFRILGPLMRTGLH